LRYDFDLASKYFFTYLGKNFLENRNIKLTSNQSELTSSRFPTRGVYLFVCLVAALLSIRWSNNGTWRTDNHMIFSFNPMRGLSSSFNIWENRQNMGGTSSAHLPFQYAIMAVIRSVGFSVARAQQVWVCLLLMMGGMGASRLAFALRPRDRVGALVTGVVFITSPFVIGFLFPTWLFVYTVVCPWILAAVIEGSRGLHLWKWSAIIGLTVAAAGSNNIPALAYSMFPAICWAIIVFISVPTARKNFLKLSVRVALLTIPILMPIIIRIVVAKGQLEANLASTETSTIIASNSSWSESWRGFGSWILYYNPGGKLVVRYFESYITSPWLILSTMAIPAIAVAALLFVRGWERLLLAGIAVIAVTLMVGTFSTGAPTLFGQLWEQLLEKTPLFALRNSYKAGSVLLTVIALLMGFLTQELWLRAQGRKFVLIGTATIFVTLFTVSSSALWTGGIYDASHVMKTADVPDYWHEAMDWLGAQESPGSFLVAPPGDAVSYLWGDVSIGDIFPSIAQRPFLLSNFFDSRSPDSNDTVRWLANWLARPGYRSGDLSQIAQRIGLKWVVLRNDLSSNLNSSIPPTQSYDALRNDPGIKLVASFGRFIGGVRAIEILQVADPQEARIVSLTPPTIVSGDAEAWGLLFRSGQQDKDRPFMFSGSMSDSEIGQAIKSGSPIIITDTNTRRSRSFGAINKLLSTNDTNRVRDRFGSSETQTVAQFGDAKSIRETNLSTSTQIAQGTTHQVKSAFDNDLSTSWITGYYSKQALSNSVTVVFNKVEPVTSIELVAASGTNLRGLKEAGILLSDGKYLRATFIDGKSTITFPNELKISGFVLRIENLEPEGVAPFGLSEVIVNRGDGSIIDFGQQERLPIDIADAVGKERLPIDIVNAVGSDPDVLAALAGVDFEFAMQRKRTWIEDLDLKFARTFKAPDQRIFTLTGRIDASGNSSDELLSQLVSTKMKVTGSSRRDGLAKNSAAWTIDGDLSTAWQPEPGEDSILTLDPSGTDVHEISFVFNRPIISSLSSPFIEIREGEEIIKTIDLRTTACQIGSPCILQTDLKVNKKGEPFEIIFPVSSNISASNWSVYEISINEMRNDTIGCINDMILVNGIDTPIRITNRQEILSGLIDFEGCAPTTLNKGWNNLEAGAGVDTVWLTSPGSSDVAIPETHRGKVTSVGSTGVVVESIGPAWVLLPRGLTDYWSATVNGQTVPTVALDTQTGIQINSTGQFTLVLRHKLESWYRFAAILGVIFTLLCLALSLWPRRIRPGTRNNYSTDFHLSAFAPFATVGSGMMILLIGGVSSWCTAGIFIIVWWKFKVEPSVAVSVALISFIASAVTALLPVNSSLSILPFAWSRNRPLSNSLAQLASVMILTSIFCWSLQRWQSLRQLKSPQR